MQPLVLFLAVDEHDSVSVFSKALVHFLPQQRFFSPSSKSRNFFSPQSQMCTYIWGNRDSSVSWLEIFSSSNSGWLLRHWIVWTDSLLYVNISVLGVGEFGHILINPLTSPLLVLWSSFFFSFWMRPRFVLLKIRTYFTYNQKSWMDGAHLTSVLCWTDLYLLLWVLLWHVQAWIMPVDALVLLW